MVDSGHSRRRRFHEFGTRVGRCVLLMHWWHMGSSTVDCRCTPQSLSREARAFGRCRVFWNPTIHRLRCIKYRFKGGRLPESQAELFRSEIWFISKPWSNISLNTTAYLFCIVLSLSYQLLLQCIPWGCQSPNFICLLVIDVFKLVDELFAAS